MKNLLPFEPFIPVRDRYTCTLNRRFSKHGSQYKVINKIDYGQRVLDVGCATGYVGKILREEKRCYVVGIEKDRTAAEIAAKYLDDVIKADIEEIDSLPFPEGFFTVILCCDILEHLKRPDIVLIKLKRYLARNGVLIAVIPNIGIFP